MVAGPFFFSPLVVKHPRLTAHHFPALRTALVLPFLGSQKAHPAWQTHKHGVRDLSLLSQRYRTEGFSTATFAGLRKRGSPKESTSQRVNHVPGRRLPPPRHGLERRLAQRYSSQRVFLRIGIVCPGGVSRAGECIFAPGFQMDQKLVRCIEGHVYDSARNEHCPLCGARALAKGEDPAKHGRNDTPLLPIETAREGANLDDQSQTRRTPIPTLNRPTLLIGAAAVAVVLLFVGVWASSAHRRRHTRAPLCPDRQPERRLSRRRRSMRVQINRRLPRVHTKVARAPPERNKTRASLRPRQQPSVTGSP
ncbi:hypothetical protein HYPDE_28258 [Hyphomicrobium denitrificans 1NES1]|uniref:Uncharacterized protein n=1 Tax=Hyphomicrobium denitrificans 1NES1 TaxID=670307 RepID=N0B9V4_9HYPH|nr:hypothetical protein HYPDE_28258 [Hyphomicrobium denitrificans 1NES1]